jgi:hypothetical protein
MPILTALAALTAAALALHLWHLGFPLGYHADEAGKVREILGAPLRFFHPLLLIRLSRLLLEPWLWLRGGGGEWQALLAGRAVSALAGALLVPAVYALARRGLPRPAALLAAATTVATPIVAVHAHYLKEDLLLTLFTVASLLAALRFAEHPSLPRAAVWGCASGLLVASKYTGLLLWAVQAGLLLGVWMREAPARRRLGLLRLGGGVLAALGVFAWIQLPALAHPDRALAGALFEARHAVEGHGPFRFSATAFWGTFHLRYSLAPGLGVPLLVAVLAGAMLLVGAGRGEIRRLDRFLALSALGLWAAVELSPTKPFPDFQRYVLPLVPLLVILGLRGVWSLRRRGPALLPAALALWLLAAGWSAAAAVRQVAAFDEDPRGEVKRWLEHTGTPARRELFAAAAPDVDSVARLDPEEERRAGVRYLVASSFLYEWIFLACEHGGCTAEGETLAAGYRRLFRCPYREVRPSVPASGFQHPTLRVVDLAGCPEEVSAASIPRAQSRASSAASAVRSSVKREATPRPSRRMRRQRRGEPRISSAAAANARGWSKGTSRAASAANPR